jgi:inosine-uridine nucleoside N-ribohydrolase
MEGEMPMDATRLIALCALGAILLTSRAAVAQAGSPLLREIGLTGAKPLPVFLSTDCGTEIDDQWAVIYLTISPEFRVLGFVGNHARNGLSGAKARDTVLDVLENRLRTKDHPPVFAGADGPLSAPDRPSPNDGVRFLVEQSKAFTPTDRLNVLIIGSQTDIASAILTDPSIVDRIRVVMMGFRDWPAGGDDWNVQNDPTAARIVFGSGVPIVVGAGEVCKRHLIFSDDDVRALMADAGPVGQWLADCFVAYGGRYDIGGRKVWPIWDVITVAYLLGYTRTTAYHRPLIAEDLSFDHSAPKGQLGWVDWIDQARLWPDFVAKLRAWEERPR